ncbi:MAG: hypothetical protein L0241_00270, partial [Planctomycetia bacterium]|nr:hypothetical protein [Planctomycetia bacterium]
LVAQGRWGYVAPVAELVGWTVLSGKELSQFRNIPLSSSGTTIVNAKLGVRVGFGQLSNCSPYASPYLTRSDLYVGYGRALTGAVWYEDLLRVEYRMFF